jgi:hypothetical protein
MSFLQANVTRGTAWKSVAMTSHQTSSFVRRPIEKREEIAVVPARRSRVTRGYPHIIGIMVLVLVKVLLFGSFGALIKFGSWHPLCLNAHNTTPSGCPKMLYPETQTPHAAPIRKISHPRTGPLAASQCCHTMNCFLLFPLHGRRSLPDSRKNAVAIKIDDL